MAGPRAAPVEELWFGEQESPAVTNVARDNHTLRNNGSQRSVEVLRGHIGATADAGGPHAAAIRKGERAIMDFDHGDGIDERVFPVPNLNIERTLLYESKERNERAQHDGRCGRDDPRSMFHVMQ